MYFNCFSCAYENKDDYLHCYSTEEWLFVCHAAGTRFSFPVWEGEELVARPNPKFCQKLQGRDVKNPPLAGHHTCFAFPAFQMCLHYPCPSGFFVPFTTYGNGIFKERFCLGWEEMWSVSIADVRSLNSC